MNLTLRAVYYCSTNWRKWGKGNTIAEAKKNACLGKRINPDTQYYIQAALFNGDEMTDEEFENLRQCIVADPISGGPIYYNEDRTQEDTDMINKYHVGWLTIERHNMD